MKNLTVLLALALVLCLSGIAAAAGIDISGGYLFGNFEMGDNTLKSDANGFVLSGEMPISGPIGVKANFLSVTGKDFSVGGVSVPAVYADYYDMSATRFDILGTYDLPVSLPEGASLKALGGYSMTTADFKALGTDGVSVFPMEVKPKTNGFLIGAEGKYPVMDKLTVNGMFGLGLGMKTKVDGSPDEDAGLTVFQVSADYKIQDSISVEAGYASNKFSYDSSAANTTTGGFYLGARASF